MLTPFDLPLSNAQAVIAPSIWRRLLIQVLACDVARALIKLGIAIAANRPMMATTIMISTNVKPGLPRFLVVFMVYWFLYLRREPATGGLCMMTACSLI